ncbi:MAG: hypothetical protein IKO01_03015 [Kiritimatiellae bacterium]|nr:hypothetical protein [Kiritimatiellia bacterium]
MKSEKRKVKSLRGALRARMARKGAREEFSNDWKLFFQWLENFGRFFQWLEKFFPMVGKSGPVFPMIGKLFSNGWKTGRGGRWMGGQAHG